VVPRNILVAMLLVVKHNNYIIKVIAYHKCIELIFKCLYICLILIARLLIVSGSN
jgi:hypothetical protein